MIYYIQKNISSEKTKQLSLKYNFTSEILVGVGNLGHNVGTLAESVFSEHAVHV